MNPDVVVIGGGIVGTSCAYYLSQQGLKTCIIDRGPIGSGASRAGMSHVVTWEEPETHLELGGRSNKLYKELAQTLSMNIEYRQTGSIAIIEEPEKIENMRLTVERLNAWGVKCRMLSSQDLIQMEPNIARDVAGGAYFEEDGQVNPLYATQALAIAAKQSGAIIEPFLEVTGFEFSADRQAVTAVITKQKRIPTGAVIIAAGAWSSDVGKLAGLDIPVSPRKGVLIVTSPVPYDFINTKIILAAGYMDSVKSGLDGISVAANIQMMPNGNLLLGTSRQFAKFDLSIDLKVLEMVIQRNLRFFPALAKLSALRTWAGVRPYTSDGLPIISSVEGLAGMYLACGHEGIGITEGPITGKLISQILTHQTPDINLEQLAFKRFVNRTH